MVPAAALPFYVFNMSGACLETAMLFRKCIFMVEVQFEEFSWSQVLGHPWLGLSVSAGGRELRLKLKQKC